MDPRSITEGDCKKAAQHASTVSDVASHNSFSIRFPLSIPASVIPIPSTALPHSSLSSPTRCGSFTSLFLTPSLPSLPANIHTYWVWGFWISPLAYAQTALCANEFLAPQWQVVSHRTAHCTLHAHLCLGSELYCHFGSSHTLCFCSIPSLLHAFTPVRGGWSLCLNASPP